MRKILLLVLIIFLVGCAPTKEVRITDVPPWYDPLVLEVDPGTKVVWDNGMAAVVHPVNTISGPEDISSGHFTKTFEHTFNEPGVYHYFCPIHPYMQGFVAVGEPAPSENLPVWFDWPPETSEQEIPGSLPPPGVGELWLDAQFQMVPGKEKPGVILVIDAETWQVTDKIDDKRLNNPHNMWLSDDGDYILQTNWFDNYLSIISRERKSIVKHIYVGESPAHVVTARGNAYVTLQGADGIVILNGTTFDHKRSIRTISGAGIRGEPSEEEKALLERGRGPHGHWVSADGSRMAVANTEGGGLTVWNLENNRKILHTAVDPLPLFAGISPDGKFAWTASLLTGKFEAFDVDSGEKVAEFNVGKGPIQNVPSPDGKYILSALSGDGTVAVIDAENFEIIKTLPSGAGAHGVYYGPSKDGGLYAYVSNKFVPWIAVIDMDSLEIAGYVPVPKESLGGQGILSVY